MRIGGRGGMVMDGRWKERQARLGEPILGKYICLFPFFFFFLVLVMAYDPMALVKEFVHEYQEPTMLGCDYRRQTNLLSLIYSYAFMNRCA